MKTRVRMLVLLASVGVLFSNCQRMQPLVVEPENVRFAGIGLRGATLIADLRIENPNEFPIQTDSITFTLEASAPSEPGKWTRVTSGVNHERLNIGARSTTTAGVPIELGYADMSGPINAMLDKGTFNYRIRGDVLLREPHRRKAPFQQDRHAVVFWKVVTSSCVPLVPQRPPSGT